MTLHPDPLDSLAVLECLPVATMVLDAGTGGVLFMNAAFRDLFGYEPGELKNERDWWPLAFPNPRYREHIAREWGRRIADAKDAHRDMQPLEAVAIGKDGREYTLRKLLACHQEMYIVTLIDVTGLKLLQDQFEHIAITDELTGLINRRAFLSMLEQSLSLATRHGRPLSIMIADIDHFRSVNEAFGHQGGDVVITHLSGLINNSLRSSDTAARIGGEKFALLLPETGGKGAIRIAERLRSVIAENVCYYSGSPIHITLSFGLASLPAEDSSPLLGCKQFLHMAEVALKTAKNEGRNRVSMQEWRNVEDMVGDRT